MISRSTTHIIKVKRLLLFVFFTVVGQLAFAQSNKVIDSLKNVLKTAVEDTNKVHTLIVLCERIMRTSNYIESKKYGNEALALAQKLNNRNLMASSYNRIGLICLAQDNYPEALKNFLASLKLFEDIGERVLAARAYVNVGIIYRSKGNYPEALKNFLASLKIFEGSKDSGSMAVCYINMGQVFQLQNDKSSALNSYLAALKIFQKSGSKGSIAIATASIGSVYMEMGNYSEALKNYLDALKLFEEFRSKGAIALSYIKLGELYIKLNKYSEAKHYITNGLSLSKEIGSLGSIADAYGGLSKLDSAIGNYKQALVHYKLYTDYKDSMLNETNSKQVTQMKEQYESEKKDKEILLLTTDKQILESEKQISALLLKTKQDSLSISQADNDKVQLENDKVKLENEKIQALNLYNQQQIILLGNEKQIQQLQIDKNNADYAIKKAEADKKQEQLVVLNKEKTIQSLDLKRQKQAKNYFIAGLALFAILSFFVYRNYRTRQKLKLQTLRNKIASDLHDDIGSTLSSISIFSQMALEESKEVKPLLQTIGDSSRKMLDAMADIVWTINPENDQFDKIIMRMRSFAYELLGARQIEFRFVADSNIADINLSMEARRNLYLIFKEATNNMVKYAEASKAMFSIKEEQGKLVMLINDNGKGFDSHKETQGNGLKNMKKRASEMGASLMIDSIVGSGTTIKLKLAV